MADPGSNTSGRQRYAALLLKHLWSRRTIAGIAVALVLGMAGRMYVEMLQQSNLGAGLPLVREVVDWAYRKELQRVTDAAAAKKARQFQQAVKAVVDEPIQQVEEDTASMRESIDEIVNRILAHRTEKRWHYPPSPPEPYSTVRSQLKDAARRLVRASEAGDAAARQKIDRLVDRVPPGGDARVLRVFLDEQIAKRATLKLHQERAAVAYVADEEWMAKNSLDVILAIAPNDLEAINLMGVLCGDGHDARAQYELLIKPDKPELWRAMALGNLGRIARSDRDLDRAEKLHREALEIFQELGWEEGQAIALDNLAELASERRETQREQWFLDDALEIDRRLGRLGRLATGLNRLGDISSYRGDKVEAEKLYREALEIERRLGRLKKQLGLLGDFERFARDRGDLNEAEKILREKLDVVQKLGNFEGQANVLQDLAEFAKQRRDFAEARRLLTQSRDAYVKLGYPYYVKQAQDLLDKLPPE